jgi:hypothetical protein
MPCPKDFSRTDSVGRAHAGSQRQIQTYVNEKTQVLNSAVANSLAQYGLDEKDIHWVSPLARDWYSEYRDSEFLSMSDLVLSRRDFWSSGREVGPAGMRWGDLKADAFSLKQRAMCRRFTVVAAEPPLEAGKKFSRRSMQRKLGSAFLLMLTGRDGSISPRIDMPVYIS